MLRDQIKLLFGPGRDERICGLLWTLTSLLYQDQIKLLFGPGRHERICGLLWTLTSLQNWNSDHLTWLQVTARAEFIVNRRPNKKPACHAIKRTIQKMQEIGQILKEICEYSMLSNTVQANSRLQCWVLSLRNIALSAPFKAVSIKVLIQIEHFRPPASRGPFGAVSGPPELEAG